MYSNVLSFDEKLHYLYTIDLLLIVKLIEEYTGTHINNNLSIHTTIYGEHMSYDDYWYGLDFFIEKSNIGIINYESEVCQVYLTSYKQVYDKLEQFPEDQRENILDIFHTWEHSVSKRNKTNETALYFVDGPQITVAAEPTDMFSWFKFCKQLIELDEFCKKQIEGL